MQVLYQDGCFFFWILFFFFFDGVPRENCLTGEKKEIPPNRGYADRYHYFFFFLFALLCYMLCAMLCVYLS